MIARRHKKASKRVVKWSVWMPALMRVQEPLGPDLAYANTTKRGALVISLLKINLKSQAVRPHILHMSSPTILLPIFARWDQHLANRTR